MVECLKTGDVSYPGGIVTARLADYRSQSRFGGLVNTRHSTSIAQEVFNGGNVYWAILVANRVWSQDNMAEAL